MLEFNLCIAEVVEIRFLAEAVRLSVAENEIMRVSNVLCVYRLE